MTYEEVQPKPENIDKALAGYVATVRARYGSRLYGVVLFGSRARGDMRPDSDADVVIILKDDDWRFWQEKMALADLAYEPFVEAGLTIQPWPISLAHWMNPRSHHNPQFIEAIRQDARPLVEAA